MLSARRRGSMRVACISDGALFRPALRKTASGGASSRRVSARRPAAHRLQHDLALAGRDGSSRSVFGRARMVAHLLAVVIASGWASILSAATTSTVGASGAIFGLFGALVAVGLQLGKPGMQLVAQTSGIIVINLHHHALPCRTFRRRRTSAGLSPAFLLTLADLLSPPRRVAPVVVDATHRRSRARRPSTRTAAAERATRRCRDRLTIDDIFGPDGPIARALPGFEARPGQVQMAQLDRARHSRERAHDRRSRHRRREVARVSRAGVAQREEGRASRPARSRCKSSSCARTFRWSSTRSGIPVARRAAQGPQPLSVHARNTRSMRARAARRADASRWKRSGSGRSAPRPATAPSCRSCRARDDWEALDADADDCVGEFCARFRDCYFFKTPRRGDASPTSSSSTTRCSSSISRSAAACCRPTTSRSSTKRTSANATRPPR